MHARAGVAYPAMRESISVDKVIDTATEQYLALRNSAAKAVALR